MAETLLIVFVVFILLGMPISIAMGVGALGAAMLFPALNPIIIPTRFVGLLSDSYLLLSAPLFILAGNIAACSSAASRAQRWPTCRRLARFSFRRWCARATTSTSPRR
jgi:prepilin signal peptidase PulO-like enzyme (type II secretory pathway)